MGDELQVAVGREYFFLRLKRGGEEMQFFAGKSGGWWVGRFSRIAVFE